MAGAVFLNGEKIDLRTFEQEDVENIQYISNLPEVRRKFIYRKPRNKDQIEDEFEDLRENEESVILAISRENETIGFIAVEKVDIGLGELAIILDPEEQSNGYASEAAELVLDYAFNQLRYHTIFARTFESNKSSQALWEKLGFSREAEIRNSVYKDGKYEDSIVYNIIEDEWDE